MKIKEKMPINSLYFGVMLPSFNWSSRDSRSVLEKHNLFGFSKVKLSVAIWVANGPEFQKEHEFLPWCFGDVRARTQYEYIVCPWPYSDEDTIENSGRKYDTYALYVEPNAELLEDLVSRVSVSSAKTYIREYRRAYKR